MQRPVVQSPLFSVLSSGGSSFAPGSQAGLLQVDPWVDPWDPAWDGSSGSVYHLGAARNAAEIDAGIIPVLFTKETLRIGNSCSNKQTTQKKKSLNVENWAQ